MHACINVYSSIPTHPCATLPQEGVRAVGCLCCIFRTPNEGLRFRLSLILFYRILQGPRQFLRKPVRPAGRSLTGDDHCLGRRVRVKVETEQESKTRTKRHRKTPDVICIHCRNSLRGTNFLNCTRSSISFSFSGHKKIYHSICCTGLLFTLIIKRNRGQRAKRISALRRCPKTVTKENGEKSAVEKTYLLK